MQVPIEDADGPADTQHRAHTAPPERALGIRVLTLAALAAVGALVLAPPSRTMPLAPGTSVWSAAAAGAVLIVSAAVACWLAALHCVSLGWRRIHVAQWIDDPWGLALLLLLFPVMRVEQLIALAGWTAPSDVVVYAMSVWLIAFIGRTVLLSLRTGRTGDDPPQR